MNIKIGEDEFCTKCMEWQEYTEDGKCKVCGKIIKKVRESKIRDSYDEYKTEDVEIDDVEEYD